MEPVSKLGTFTPPMSTSKWGQEEISSVTSKLLETSCEPVAAPPKLWLCSSVGTSFPTPKQNEVAYQHGVGVAKEIASEEEHALHHNPLQCDQAGCSGGILWGQYEVDDCAAGNSATEQYFQVEPGTGRYFKGPQQSGQHRSKGKAEEQASSKLQQGTKKMKQQWL
ncbi:unnamed protein product [Merluccius merluccius]